MVKIEVNTTLRNEQYLNGLARNGDTFSVPEDYAKELVEEKGYASYIEDSDEIVEVKGVNYPKGFLDMEIPENFPNEKIYSAITEAGLKKIGEIVKLDDPTEIKGIGDEFASVLSEEIIEAKKVYQESK